MPAGWRPTSPAVNSAPGASCSVPVTVEPSPGAHPSNAAADSGAEPGPRRQRDPINLQRQAAGSGRPQAQPNYLGLSNA